MELTTEQALQQGVTAHKEGKLQDAERLYRAILKSQPTHPDANHNLGLIAVSVNKTDAAVPLFKAALAANPEIEQFWLSYIDALIKLKQFDNAKQVIQQGKQKGINKEKLNTLDRKIGPIKKPQKNDGTSPSQAQINTLIEHYQNKRFDAAEKLSLSITKQFPAHQFGWKALGAVLKQTGRITDSLTAMQKSVQLAPQDAEAHSNLGVMLQELGRLDEAEASYKHVIALKTDSAEAHFNLGAMLQELGRLDEAESSYKQAIALKPDYAKAHNNLGSTLKELGRSDESKASYKQAITMKPDSAEAHNNLGAVLQELGRLEESEASCKRAISLKPDFAKAYSNLGNTLHELGRLDEALASYTQAIELKPDYAEAHSNLGSTLQELGRLDEAVASYTQAIELKPDFAEAYVNFGIAIENVKFNSSNPKLYPPLTQLISAENFTRPKDVAKSILSLLKQDDKIKDLLLKKNYAVSLSGATSIIRDLDKIPLLHHLMRLCPLPDLHFEEIFVAMRIFLLKNLDNMKVSPELIYFLSTLSIHCFTNEYVYIESDEETRLIGELQKKISQSMAQSEQPEAIKILCLASYRPLHQYDWCQKLESLDNLEEVKKRLIEEPLLEKILAKDIRVLEEISDEVSLKVREQYEENPYPRWVKLGVSIKAKPVVAVCDDLKLQLYSENIKNVTAPFILIAGCGTGQHSIGTASRFSNCHVTAVDLSLASLAYAQRKSNELCFTDIDYLQADILYLHQMGKEFDIIESVGVLHHMDEPMAGWRVLVDLLKPGGLMKIGLYSELARNHIVEVRNKIASLGLGTSATEIRNFRELSRASEIHDIKQLSTFSDFFSLSEFRDLVFHVQEHRFTLPQIKNSLDKLGLKFCGFEVQGINSRFRALHGNEADIYDLELWHQYEERNPRAFVGMYQFWCQRH
jgi:tetratricopeptide (TPR) repeat protein/2-polyprenyl-3-methyl-5-hydroxy-6-metoxy-1,4-benzoquinol methylase